MCQYIYSVENATVVPHNIDDVRERLNWLNGCPTSSGNSPKYQIHEETEYRVMQAGQDGYPDRQYSAHSSQSWADDDLCNAREDEPERNAWIDEATVYVVGYNAHGKFNRFAMFDTRKEAEEELTRCMDELIERDPTTAWFSDPDEAILFCMAVAEVN